MPRFRNLKERNPNFIRAYGFEGSSGNTMFPQSAFWAKGFGSSYKKQVRDYAGAFIDMGGFGEVLARYENYVDIDPEVKDKWGIPALRFHYKFGDNEKKMAADMSDAAREMFEQAGIEIVEVKRQVLTEGWSIHELGTARMGTDPKTSEHPLDSAPFADMGWYLSTLVPALVPLGLAGVVTTDGYLD